MDKNIIFIFCATLSLMETKTYRKDYTYDWRTDAFYKLHIDRLSMDDREKVCDEEGARLMPPMSYQELSQFRAKMRHQLPYTEEDGDFQEYDPDERRAIFDSELEAKDVLAMTCQITTKEGYVKTNAVYRDKFFICKVEAKDIPYDSQCRLHATGYRFFPSIGSCYKIPLEKRKWDDAAAQCQAEGAHLAIINSEQEALVLKNLSKSIVSSQAYVIIGFKVLKDNKPRTFRTIFNQTLEEAGFSAWASGEPSNLNGAEYCGSLHVDEAKLNDIGCHSHYYICEKEVICQCKP